MSSDDADLLSDALSQLTAKLDAPPPKPKRDDFAQAVLDEALGNTRPPPPTPVAIDAALGPAVAVVDPTAADRTSPVDAAGEVPEEEGFAEEEAPASVDDPASLPLRQALLAFFINTTQKVLGTNRDGKEIHITPSCIYMVTIVHEALTRLHIPHAVVTGWGAPPSRAFTYPHAWIEIEGRGAIDLTTDGRFKSLVILGNEVRVSEESRPDLRDAEPLSDKISKTNLTLGKLKRFVSPADALDRYLRSMSSGGTNGVLKAFMREQTNLIMTAVARDESEQVLGLTIYAGTRLPTVSESDAEAEAEVVFGEGDGGESEGENDGSGGGEGGASESSDLPEGEIVFAEEG